MAKEPVTLKNLEPRVDGLEAGVNRLNELMGDVLKQLEKLSEKVSKVEAPKPAKKTTKSV